MGPVKIFSGKYFDNEKELNFDETNDYLINQKKENSLALNNAKALHTVNFDNFDLRGAGVDLYNIVGCKTGTLPQIWDYEHTADTHVNYELADDVPGDGTVPLESATNLPVDQSHKYYALKADHGKMPSQDGIRQTIVNAISGSSLDVGGSITQDISKCKLKGKAIFVYSPLNIEVTDQNGNRLGLASDGSLQNDIPEADFNISGEHKFLYLPDDEGQTYTIKVTGTGSGVFTLKLKDIDGGVQSTAVFASIPVSASLTGNLVSISDGPHLDLDTNADGQIDETLYPSAMLDQNQSLDMIPSISSASVLGNKDADGSFVSGTEVDLTAQDQVIAGQENQTSGVLKVLYQLDGGVWQEASSTFDSAFINATATPVNVRAAGQHKISFYSIDRAGNTEETQSTDFTIVNPPEASSAAPVTPALSVGGGSVYFSPVALPVATTTVATTTPVSSSTPTTVVLSAATYNFPRNLKFGMKGDDVKFLQQFLNTQGFILAKYGAGAPGNETIYFGPRTRAALIRFQKNAELKPTGQLDDITRAYVKLL